MAVLGRWDRHGRLARDVHGRAEGTAMPRSGENKTKVKKFFNDLNINKLLYDLYQSIEDIKLFILDLI